MWVYKHMFSVLNRFKWLLSVRFARRAPWIYITQPIWRYWHAGVIGYAASSSLSSVSFVAAVCDSPECASFWRLTEAFFLGLSDSLSWLGSVRLESSSSAFRWVSSRIIMRIVANLYHTFALLLGTAHSIQLLHLFHNRRGPPSHGYPLDGGSLSWGLEGHERQKKLQWKSSQAWRLFFLCLFPVTTSILWWWGCLVAYPSVRE